MILFKTSIQLRNHLNRLKATGKKTGFVPTMGALHNGHISLLQESLSGNEYTVCSIFINPTQFNDASDFRKYPVIIEKDIYSVEQTGTQILFLPDVKDIYPEGTDDLQTFELGKLENTLEGKFRPNHFQGVCQVMYRLLNIVQPDNLYMGQKDYQQCMVVNRLLQIMHADTTLHKCPTQREADGLAMSSRNIRLNADERKKAATISAVLQYIKENLKPGELTAIIQYAKERLVENQFKTDYVEIADALSLEKVHYWNGEQPLVALIAAYLNEVRLIDNMTISG